MDPEILSSLKQKIHAALGWNHPSFPKQSPKPLRRNTPIVSLFTQEAVVSSKKKGLPIYVYHGPEGFYWYGKSGKIGTIFLEFLPKLFPPREEVEETYEIHEDPANVITIHLGPSPKLLQRNEEDMFMAEKPTPKIIEDFTLFSGTWVIAEKKIYVDDVCVVRGQNVMKYGLGQRISEFAENWLKYLRSSNTDQFKIQITEYWDLHHADAILKSDKGILIRSGIASFWTNDFWYWVPPETIHIYLRIRLKYEGNVINYSLWGLDDTKTKERLYCNLTNLQSPITGPRWEDGVFAECRYEQRSPISLTRSGGDWVSGDWIPTKVRKDKVQPTRIKKVWSLLVSLRENITLEELKSWWCTRTYEEEIEWVDAMHTEA